MTREALGLAALFVLIAGCSSPIDSQRAADGLDLRLDPVAPTMDDTVRVAGTVSGHAQLSVLAQREGVIVFETAMEVDGAWNLDIAGLPFGQPTCASSHTPDRMSDVRT